MKNIKVQIAIVILVFIAGGTVFFITKPPVTTTPKTETPVVETGKTYTLAEVAIHKNAQSCWTAIRGNVYDLTSWVSQHPGGRDAILSLCGRDGTKAFVEQHGGQGNPEAELKSLLIGKLQ